MNIKWLSYFVAVARTNNISQAAQECFVSQPTLSMQLQKLEEQLSVQLFERTPRHMRLTDAGRQLLPQAQHIITCMEQLKSSAKQLLDPLAGRCVLGVIPTIAPYLLPRCLRPIMQACPALDLVLQELKTDDIFTHLTDGQLDAGIIAQTVDERDWHSIVLYREPFYLVCAKTHRLAKRKRIRLSDIDADEWLLLDEGHCLREQAMRICNLSGRQDVAGATSLPTLAALVAADYGVTLMPEMALSSLNDDVLVKAVEGKVAYRDVTLIWRKTVMASVLFDRLARVLQGLE